MAVVESVSNPRYRSYDGLPYLVVAINGRDYLIDDEQKLLGRWGIVVLAPSPEEQEDRGSHLQFTAVIPPDPEDGRPLYNEVEGATNDPRVVRLTKRYIADIASDRWRPGPVPQ